MPSPQDIAHQRDLLALHRVTHRHLLEQAAVYGGLEFAPTVTAHAIRITRADIQGCKDALRAWGELVEDLPGERDPQDATASAPARRMRVFISYKHKVVPDATLATQLAEALDADYDVFIDTDLVIGARWAEQIKIELAHADALIALMSAPAAESEMVREEIALAHTLSQAQNRPRILPVRVAYQAPFPYPLNEYLDALHWAFWDGPSDTPALLDALRRALSGGGLPIQSREQKHSLLALDQATSSAPQSMAQMPSARPAVRLEPPGTGSMDADSRFYIARATDEQALAAVSSTGGRGTTLTIKGPRQMGKSSLLMRVIDAAATAGKRVAMLDFQFFDQAALRDPDIFFRQFCAWLSDALELDDRADEFWNAQLGNSQRCTRYVERYLLKEIDAPLVLAMDEVESMFDADFRSDFFSMLRGWHNSRAAKLAWRRLDLALVTSTEPYQLIANLNQSPFNVGQVIALDDFTAEQAGALNELHGAPLDPAGERRLYELLGGHPYLTRRALYQIASGRSSAAELFRDAATEQGPFSDHLRYHLFRMHDQPKLVQGLRQVIQQRRCDDEMVFWRLHGAGLVRGDMRSARMRNQLYAEFFGMHLKR